MSKHHQKKERLTEFCDIYDAQGRPLGRIKRLADIHRDGDWHRSFHCWIINPSVRRGSILLQRRGMWKRNWPGKVDTSAAGHYRAGEGIEGGLRELAEEIGVYVKEEDLIDVDTRIAVSEFEQGIRNHEFQDVRFLIDARPLEKYKVSFPEVDGLMLLSIKDGLALLSSQTESVDAKGFEIINTEEGQKRVYKTFRLTRDDFIPSLDHFYYKVFILADRILRGEKHLHI